MAPASIEHRLLGRFAEFCAASGGVQQWDGEALACGEALRRRRQLQRKAAREVIHACGGWRWRQRLEWRLVRW